MQRSRSHAYPNIPATMYELTATLQNPMWEFLTKTLDDEDRIYLCSVTAGDGSHSVIFLSERCLEFLRQASTIFLDGTFKISPSVAGCYQVWLLINYCFPSIIIAGPLFISTHLLQIFTIVTVFSHTVSSLSLTKLESSCWLIACVTYLAL